MLPEECTEWVNVLRPEGRGTGEGDGADETPVSPGAPVASPGRWLSPSVGEVRFSWFCSARKLSDQLHTARRVSRSSRFSISIRERLAVRRYFRRTVCALLFLGQEPERHFLAITLGSHVCLDEPCLCSFFSTTTNNTFG